MTVIGYAYVQDRLKLPLPPVAFPALIRSVTRVERLAGELAVPAKRAPGEDVIEHLLFALKHEGTDLQVLAAACAHLEPAALLAQLRAAPAGQYIRKLCAIWEAITGQLLEDLPAGISGSVALLFDPTLYVTAEGANRDKRWGVAFNGLGDWDFCPSVRRTPQLEALLKADPLVQVREFLDTVPPAQLERALAWAYLDETRSTFEIEGERPAGNKQDAFAALLRQAHARQTLDEEHWVELQNATVTSKLAQEAFGVIRTALEKSGQIALGRIVMATRERILALEPRGKGMLATTLHYAYEVCRDSDFFDAIPKIDVPREMLDPAKHIIDTKTRKFDPSKFEDRYENALVELIEAKPASKPPAAPAPAPRPSNVINLMDALRRSIDGSAGKAPTARTPRAAKPRRKAGESRRATQRKTA